jgi:dihydroflavonol-4-reductase
MAELTALVTGSTGFVGSHLCRALIERGYRVRAFHRATSKLNALNELEVEHVLGDLTQPETIPLAMQGVEVVFHTAAWMGGAHYQVGKQNSVTVEGTRYLLEAARQSGVRRVVHTSSVAALGVPLEAPRGAPLLMNEQHTWNFRPEFYPYGYAKYLAELEVQRAVAQGQDAVIVNPTLIFGDNDTYRQSSSIVAQVAERRVPVAIEGGINAVHIDDVVDGHLAALECGKTGERYILGGENLSFVALLQMIAEETHVPEPNLVLPGWLLRTLARPAEWLQMFLNLPISPDLLHMAGYFFFYDLSKAETQLGLTQHRPVRDAIREAYTWFMKSPAA